MWLWFSSLSDASDSYSKLDANEPLKYRKKRSRFIGVVFLIVLIIFTTYQFFIYRCTKEVGDYTVCRFYGGDIDAANRMLAKRGGAQDKDNGAK